MKKALSLVWCCLCPVMIYGQGIAVANDKVNVLYEGVENPLTIVLEHCDCNKLLVETDNGTLKKTEEKCKYVLASAKPGFANLSVQKKDGNKLTPVGTMKFKVKPFPLPEVGLGGRRGGAMSIQIFKAQSGISYAYHECSEMGSYPVVSFVAEVLRSGQLIFTRENKGNVFDQQTKYFFSNKIKPGDKVSFSNIKCDVYGRTRLLKSINFIIIP